MRGHNHGYSHFADSDVQDRSLEDWTGDWQSVYPYLENGDLNEVMKKKKRNPGRRLRKSINSIMRQDIRRMSRKL